LAEPLRAELQPVGELESLLVERIVAAYGRMQRLERLEAGIFAFELYGELTKRAEQEAEPYTRTETPDDEFLALFSITIITDKEKHREAMDKVRELESIRDAETATLEQSFIRDAKGANAFSKLSRYQTAIERSLYRALHELQRFQATRRAEGNVSPPVALDVDVTGVPE